MKTVLITGVSGGIGKETALLLLNEGYRVIGISRTPSGISHNFFSEHIMNLENISQLKETVLQINKETPVDILINNAGCAYYGLHEEQNPNKIQEMVTVNLTVPMVLSNLLLRHFKKNKGTIINISSVTATGSSPHGAAYAATKAGLSSFGKSIFDEARKYGVKVITIEPDMTDTGLYRNADFEADTSEGCCLFPDEVAKMISGLLKYPDTIVPASLTVKPIYHRIRRKQV